MARRAARQAVQQAQALRVQALLLAQARGADGAAGGAGAASGSPLASVQAAAGSGKGAAGGAAAGPNDWYFPEKHRVTKTGQDARHRSVGAQKVAGRIAT